MARHADKWIAEKFCTGMPGKEKFMKWAETVQFTIGNPLYHWTHLELARYFNIFELLSPATAEKIYNKASECLILQNSVQGR